MFGNKLSSCADFFYKLKDLAFSFGENRISDAAPISNSIPSLFSIIESHIDPNHCHIMEDVTLPNWSDDAFIDIELDMLLFTNYGIFCVHRIHIDNGVLSGDLDAQTWAYLKRGKKEIVNPLLETQKKAQLVEKILRMSDGHERVIPLVLVTGGVSLRIESPNLCQESGVMDAFINLTGQNGLNYSNEVVSEYIDLISKVRIT